ncbi:hypothetical protein HSE3_gp060 [Klebsiella phage vB_KleS-HSE3]|nr:hypothetical protein HSE3_gp060 [Klebsiella phage vB_KleS-HSE3]
MLIGDGPRKSITASFAQSNPYATAANPPCADTADRHSTCSLLTGVDSFLFSRFISITPNGSPLRPRCRITISATPLRNPFACWRRKYCFPALPPFSFGTWNQ